MQITDPSDAARLLQLRREARESLEAYAGYIEIPDRPMLEDVDGETFSIFEGQLAEHHRVMCRAIQRCVEKRHGRLMLMSPPGAAKSTYTSVVAPTWIMGRYPKKRIILASYGSELAEKQSKKARAICRSKRYATLFGTTLPPDNRAADEWGLTNGSQFMCGGILSGLTGNRGDCFQAGTAVSTPSGPKPIESLGIGDDVLSFDTGKHCYTIAKVIATKEIARDGFVRVTTQAGRSFICTADHRVFTREHGYREASLLGAGDTLVRAPEGPGQYDLLGVLSRAQSVGSSEPDVRGLWADDDAEAARLYEADCARGREFLLQSGLPSEASEKNGCKNTVESMPNLRKESAEGEVVLLGAMLAGKEASPTQESGHLLRTVREDVQSSEQPSAILQQGMLRQGALETDDRQGQFTLQGRNELCRMVPPDETCGDRAGRRGVRCMQDAARNGSEWPRSLEVESCDPSLRREPKEQRGLEPDRDVPAVPYEAPQIAYDTVSLVERVGGGPVKVHDIQVEATQCFFAEEILVHNCVIADDLVKGRNEAESETLMNRTWEAYRDDLRSRLVSGGSLILMNTRWTTNDVSGRILPVEWAGESGIFTGSDGMEWEVISMPAKIETPLQALTDPLHRKVGEYLWPENWDEDHWRQSDPAMGARDTNTPTGRRAWYSMYQQVPHPDDGILFRREDFNWYEPGTEPARLRMYMSADWALTDELLRPDPDWTRVLVGGLDDGKNDAGAPALWLVDAYSARQGEEVTVPAVVRTIRKWRTRLRKYFGEHGNIETLVGGLIKRECKDKGVPLLQREILPTAGQGNKVAKSGAFRKLVAERRVYLPLGRVWAEELVEECLSFPNGAHDDWVDACSLLGRGMDKMLNAEGATWPEEREKVLTPFTYEWTERMAAYEKIESAEREAYFD